VLVMDIFDLLAGAVLHDEARADVLHSPGLREAAKERASVTAPILGLAQEPPIDPIPRREHQLG
jgi:hypothetical protein